MRRWVGLAAGVGVLVAGATLAPRVTQAETAQAPAEATLPEVWQPASEDDQALIWRFVLQSPMEQHTLCLPTPPCNGLISSRLG
ncbi:MAG: hypothetical protein ACFCVB_03085 [Nodosilinea sp.]